MRHFALPALLLIATPALFPSTGVGAERAPAQIRVDIADVDLASRAGPKEILRRLRTAARELCGFTDNGPSPRMDDECIEAIVSRAVYRVRLPRLTMAYVNQTGRLPQDR